MVSFYRLCKYIFLNRPPGPRSPFHTPYMTRLLLKPGAQHKARSSTTAWVGPYPCPHCAWPYCTPGRPWGRRLSTIPISRVRVRNTATQPTCWTLASHQSCCGQVPTTCQETPSKPLSERKSTAGSIQMHGPYYCQLGTYR